MGKLAVRNRPLPPRHLTGKGIICKAAEARRNAEVSFPGVVCGIDIGGIVGIYRFFFCP